MPLNQAVFRNSSSISDSSPSAQDLSKFQAGSFNKLIPLLLWRMLAALQSDMKDDEEATQGIVYLMKGLGALLKINKEKVMLGQYPQVQEIFEVIMKSLAHSDVGVSSAAIEVSSCGLMPL